MKILKKIHAHIKKPIIKIGNIVNPNYLDGDVIGIVLSCGKNSALVKLNGGWTKPIYILNEDLFVVANNQKDFDEKLKAWGITK